MPHGQARELDEEEAEDYVGADVTKRMEDRLNDQFEKQGVHIQVLK